MSQLVGYCLGVCALFQQGEIALFSKDAAEGAVAFAQEREPQWQGR
ncbi:hypothetical protein [Nocardia sp. NPDC049707]